MLLAAQIRIVAITGKHIDVMEGYVEHICSFELHPLKHPEEQRSCILFQDFDWLKLPSLEPPSVRLPPPLQRVIPWAMDLLFPLEYHHFSINSSFTQDGIMASTNAYGRFPGRTILGAENLPNLVSITG